MCTIYIIHTQSVLDVVYNTKMPYPMKTSQDNVASRAQKLSLSSWKNPYTVA